MIMAKFLQMLSRNLGLAAIIAIACVYVHPAFGQKVVSSDAREVRGMQSQPEDLTLKVFKLAHSDADIMAHVLAQSVPGINVATDQRNNAVVVGGAKEKLQIVQDLIDRLDSTNSNEKNRFLPVSVRLVWLVEGDESAAPPAENLKGVVEELRHQGLKNLGQVAQTVVRGQYGNNFHISCSPLLENKPTILSADGMIMPGGELEIRVASARPGGPENSAFAPGMADMQGMAMTGVVGSAMPAGRAGMGMMPGGPPRQSSAEFAEKLTDLNVHTSFKPNDYIVLAVAPIGKITSVFVIQITESNP
jgi:Bacterial type II/III secretion system short domain